MFRHIWTIFIQINIPIKEEQIKSMKGKIYKIFFIHLLSFFVQKNHRNEDRYLTDIFNEDC